MRFTRALFYGNSFAGMFIRLMIVLASVGYEHADALTVDRIIATINNEIVLLSDYQRFAHKYSPGRQQDGIDEILLRNLLEEKIVYLEAKRQGLDVSDGELEQGIRDFQRQNGLSQAEFERRLAEEGMSLQDYRKLLKENMISLKLINKEVDSKIAVSDKEVAQYYNDNSTLFLKEPEKVRVMAVFLRLSENPSLTEITDLKIKSLKISDEIKRGVPFERLVALYDEESLKARDGLLGEFGKGELLPELDRHIQQMRESETSSPIWTKEGVYIIKLSKRIKGAYTPIEDVRQSIYATLHNKKREALYNSWMTSLWSKSTIKIKQ